jgi:hypothetical protein
LKFLVLLGAEDEAMRHVVGVKNPPDDLSEAVDGGRTRALEIASARVGSVEGLGVAIGETDKTVVDEVGVKISCYGTRAIDPPTKVKRAEANGSIVMNLPLF